MPTSQQDISQSLRDAGKGVLAQLANALPIVGTVRARMASHYLELAEKARLDGDLAAAIPLLEKALKWSAVKGTAYEALGVIYFELRDYKNAKSNLMLAILDNFKQGVTPSLPTLKSIAVIFLEEGDFSQSMYYYLKALEVPGGPSDDTVLTNLGAVFYNLGQYEESLKYSQLALVIRPDEPLILGNIGRALYALGDLEAATEKVSLAVGLNPLDGELARLLAFCYQAKGESDRAIATLTAALDSGDPEVFLELAIALDDQGRHEESAQASSQALELSRLAGRTDREATAYWQLGWSAYKLNEFQRSVDASRKAVELDPSLFAAEFNLALVLLLMGDQDGARRHYEKGMTTVREPSDIKFHAMADLEAAVKARGEVAGAQPILTALQERHAAMSKALAEETKESSAVSR